MSRFLVVLDVAPEATRRRVDRALRDLGFEEVLPCVYADRWSPPAAECLRTSVRRALRGGAGRVLVTRIGRGGAALLAVRAGRIVSDGL